MQHHHPLTSCRWWSPPLCRSTWWWWHSEHHSQRWTLCWTWRDESPLLAPWGWPNHLGLGQSADSLFWCWWVPSGFCWAHLLLVLGKGTKAKDAVSYFFIQELYYLMIYYYSILFLLNIHWWTWTRPFFIFQKSYIKIKLEYETVPSAVMVLLHTGKPQRSKFHEVLDLVPPTDWSCSH